MSKPITKRNKSLIDSMIIGCGHSIMVSNVPEIVQDKEKLVSLSDNFFQWTGANHESIQSLGFWGGDIDYNTYYPDLNTEELKPKEDEFITPMFRLLSETIVSKNYNPTDFGQNGVLKASMRMLLGQTVNCDHETNIGNAIGAVSKVVWQEAYKEGNFTIPGGINGILKIDGKANPRIARGILMDPPSIHSNSVTVQFRWDKSHPEMDDRDFYEKLGTYDQHGNMIRRMVTEVVRYMETSLVSHGADSFAQKIGSDGKIVNPEYAKKTWSSYEEYRDDDSKKYYFMDTKSYSYKDDDTNEDITKDKTQTNKNDMNEELKEFLEKLFGKNMLTLSEGKEPSTEEAISLISDLITTKNSLNEKITNLTNEVNSLKSENQSLSDMANIGKASLVKLRENAVNNYKKLQGDKFDEKDPVFIMLNSDTTPLITLEGLNSSYEQRLNELFPMKCSHCGSRDVSRASSVEEPEKKEGDSKLTEVLDNSSAAMNIINRKNSYK